tara:strand:- start:931 stop:1362 length:432 start_codon:yes stop_codon:yes gene_type:complete
MNLYIAYIDITYIWKIPEKKAITANSMKKYFKHFQNLFMDSLSKSFFKCLKLQVKNVFISNFHIVKTNEIQLTYEIVFSSSKSSTILNKVINNNMILSQNKILYYIFKNNLGVKNPIFSAFISNTQVVPIKFIRSSQLLNFEL